MRSGPVAGRCRLGAEGAVSPVLLTLISVLERALRQPRGSCDDNHATLLFRVSPQHPRALGGGRRGDGEQAAEHGDLDARPASGHGCALRYARIAYWITSSARCSKDCGIVRPSALAVLRLITSSNLVGCSTGRSPGFAPLRILSTYVAARRNKSATFGP